MNLLMILKRPPSKRAIKKRKTICYVMTRKAGVMTIYTTLPKIPLKGGS
jgi:hypothetical protein